MLNFFLPNVVNSGLDLDQLDGPAKIFNADIWYIHQIIGSKPKSLIEVAKMVSEGRNQASTPTTNLLYFSQWSNKTNIQMFLITIQLVCQRPCWQISAVKCT